MRFAKATFTVAVVLFLAGGLSVAGPWAVSLGSVLFLGAAVVAAVCMEDRDLYAVEGLLPDEPSHVVVEDGDRSVRWLDAA